MQHKPLQHRLLAFTTLILLVPAIATADFSAGMAAFENEDYKAAFQEWITPASTGDVKSLYGLGTLFAGGLGVPQNFSTAHILFNVAAFKGDQQSAAGRDAVEAKMTPEQIQAAKNQVLPLVEQRQWVPSDVIAMAQNTRSAPAPTPPASPAPGAPPQSGPPPSPAPAPVSGSASAGPAVDWTFACAMKLSWKDKGSGGKRDVSLFTPSAPAGYQIVGGYAQGNYKDADGCVMALKQKPGSAVKLLEAPLEWRQSWTDAGAGSRKKGSVWTAVSPSPDYVCLGSVGQEGYSQPAVANYACVHKCLLKSVPVAGPVWTDKGTGAKQPVRLYRLPVSNSFVAGAGAAPRELFDVDPGASCP